MVMRLDQRTGVNYDSMTAVQVGKSQQRWWQKGMEGRGQPRGSLRQESWQIWWVIDMMGEAYIQSDDRMVRAPFPEMRNSRGDLR